MKSILLLGSLCPLLGLTVVPPVAAEVTVNSADSFLVGQLDTVVEIIGIQLQPREKGLEVIIETAFGESLIPIMVREDNTLIIDLVDATLALPTGTDFRETDFSEDIVEITATTVDEKTVRITITGKNQAPMAEVVPSSQNLVLNVTPDSTSIVRQRDDGDITITITGTRTPRPVLDSTASITIIDSQQIEREIIRDIRDLIRYEPGVSVGTSPGRFGNQDFNIRGIDGNRVLIQIDGIRTPDNFVGRGRDYFDLETIKRVEIIKGPASALYGSDAIGGVVSFITKDPEDYLSTFGNSVYTSAQVTYSTRDDGVSFTGVVAAEDEEKRMQFSAAFSYVGASELKTRSDVTPNPQDIRDLNLTTKFVGNINENHSLKLTGELIHSKTDTELLNEIGLTPFNLRRPPFVEFFDRQNVQAEDTRNRYRISLDYNYTQPESNWLQQLNAKLYFQSSRIKEDKISQGILQQFGRGRPTFTPVIRDERNSFEQTVYGGDVQLESNFLTGNARHRLVYGFEVFNTETSRPRDNTLINLRDGSTSKFVVGEEFPNKTFPDTGTFRAAVYIQDEIEIGKFSIIPGLRWDYYLT